jgi:CheY-like chemotaxis protein
VKILLAEDSVFARQLLQSTLTASSCEVVLAEDGETAWLVRAAGRDGR